MNSTEKKTPRPESLCVSIRPRWYIFLDGVQWTGGRRGGSYRNQGDARAMCRKLLKVRIAIGRPVEVAEIRLVPFKTVGEKA